jgi:hypothetical protein
MYFIRETSKSDGADLTSIDFRVRDAAIDCNHQRCQAPFHDHRTLECVPDVIRRQNTSLRISF